MYPSSPKKASLIHYSHPSVVRTISDCILSLFPNQPSSIVILCIGTDRSTGDALGPMTGTILQKMLPKTLLVKGTLQDPVHALNLDTVLDDTFQLQPNPFIIAIDASLGQLQSVGHFQYGTGSITPGAALNKQLPSVGDAFITGIVNISSAMQYATLQSTRLSLVYDMSQSLAKILFHIDLTLQKKMKHHMYAHFPYLKINNEYTV